MPVEFGRFAPSAGKASRLHCCHVKLPVVLYPSHLLQSRAGPSRQALRRQFLVPLVVDQALNATAEGYGELWRI